MLQHCRDRKVHGVMRVKRQKICIFAFLILLCFFIVIGKLCRTRQYHYYEPIVTNSFRPVDLTVSEAIDSDKADEYEIGSKLQNCFNSLNMNLSLVPWNAAKGNALTITRWLRTILPRGKVHVQTNEPLNACWNTSFNLHSPSLGTISGYIGSESVNFTLSKYFSDRWKIYPGLLYLRSGIREGIQSDITCIPQTFIAGFVKSGTTALDSMINAHPKVDHGIVKEPRWWQPYTKTPYYRSHFISETPYFIKYLLQYYQAIHRLTIEKGVMLLDSSPQLLVDWFSVGPVVEKYQDVCLIPTVMSTILPHIKVIVIIRDPLDFLYSCFWYYCSNYVLREKTEKLTREQQLQGPRVFHSLVIRRLQHFNECRKINSVETCAFDQQFLLEQYPNDFTCGAVPIGSAIYYVHIQKWLSVIPRESFYFVSSAEFLHDQLQITANIWEFLNLEQPVKNTIKNSPMRNNSQKDYNYKHDPKLFMLPETRKLLEEFYQPLNSKLADLLHDEKFRWQYN